MPRGRRDVGSATRVSVPPWRSSSGRLASWDRCVRQVPVCESEGRFSPSRSGVSERIRPNRHRPGVVPNRVDCRTRSPRSSRPTQSDVGPVRLDRGARLRSAPSAGDPNPCLAQSERGRCEDVRDVQALRTRCRCLDAAAGRSGRRLTWLGHRAVGSVAVIGETSAARTLRRIDACRQYPQCSQRAQFRRLRQTPARVRAICRGRRRSDPTDPDRRAGCWHRHRPPRSEADLIKGGRVAVDRSPYLVRHGAIIREGVGRELHIAAERSALRGDGEGSVRHCERANGADERRAPRVRSSPHVSLDLTEALGRGSLAKPPGGLAPRGRRIVGRHRLSRLSVGNRFALARSGALAAAHQAGGPWHQLRRLAPAE